MSHPLLASLAYLLAHISRRTEFAMPSPRRVQTVFLLLFVVGVMALLITDNRTIRTVHGYSFGPPDGKTGAPDEGSCVDCHLIHGDIGQLAITAPSSYLPGHTYQITVTHTTDDPSRLRWGFELTALNTPNNQFVGTFQNLNQTTQIIAGGPFSDRLYIEHHITGTVDGTYQGQTGGASWTFNWRAPDAPVGPVTFYAAGNQANGDGTNGGDQIYFAQASVPLSTCNYAISPTSGYFSMSGGSGSVNLTAPAGCNWTVVSNDSWITLTSSDSGSGNDVVTFEVRENFTQSARTGTLMIAGIVYTVVQDGGLGEDCNYSVFPAFSAFPSVGGSGTLNVVAEERCAWQAVSGANWITITSSNTGVGNGTVTYSVAANPGPSGRGGTITVAGKAFKVKQKFP